jgi:hypothetical protein
MLYGGYVGIFGKASVIVSRRFRIVSKPTEPLERLGRSNGLYMF